MSSSRRSEIEAKRARIAEMRKAREALQQQEAQRSTPTREDIDQLVESLVTTRIDETPGSFSIVIADAFDQVPAAQHTGTTATTATSPAASISASSSTPAATATRSTSPPICYSKGVQTDPIDDDLDLDSDETAADASRPGSGDHDEEHSASSDPAQVAIPPPDDNISVVFAEPSAVASEDLLPFVQQSLKVVERSLKPQTFDVLTDYGSQGLTAAHDEEALVSQNLQFAHSDTDGRAVLDLAWSHAFPELLVASYTEKRDSIAEAKGCVKVWNTHMPEKPEYTFVADSDVTSVLCSPFHPTLVFGGLYNGQIMVWDMRASGSQAILASPLSGSAHSHPVLALDLYGTQNASSLVSASTDGTICTWSPDILAKPQEQIVLQSASEAARNLTISPTALVTPAQDTSYFLFGTEEGSMYHCNRYDKAGASAGIDVRNSAQYAAAHLAPVTCLDLHPSKHSVDLGDYLLTSGFDWKIKLWRTSTVSATAPADAVPSSPLLHTIYRDDTVYSAKWHPSCPSLFGTVDGSGHLEVYDLLTDIDVPVARVKPQTKTASDNLLHPLNKLAWDKSGKSAAVGGFDGVVTVFELGNELLKKNTANEWKEMRMLLNKIGTV
ncbi:Cytoplasmic dynein 1 intermediate chain [Yarrowia sp. C11]|nr:Cytoplasmic dynein 1 intermediate chain [Yarrowia sp. E02]KAG5372596.1 Cytoplasmic dynein 1 intermediate chain [Yarrowia sp. C11]